MTRYTPRRFGERDWLHPSVHALMADEPPARDPFDVVRERARAVVENARSLGWCGPPFDPVSLASIEGIRTRASDGAMESDALLRVLQDESLEIVWNAEAAPTRRNFSICHEIGHTLFPDAYDVDRHRSARRRDPEDELERLCDAAAAEMLMPLPEFERDLAGLALDGAAVQALARRYAASPEAVARRIANVSAQSCAVALLTLRLKPTEERRRPQTAFDFGDDHAGPSAKLRIDYVIASAAFTTWFPPHKSVPEASCAYDALRDGDASATEEWDTGSLRVVVRAHAMTIANDDESRPRVLALLVPA